MSYFEQELAGLKNELHKMATHAEGAVKRALQALAERNPDLAMQVRSDDRVLDQFEIGTFGAIAPEAMACGATVLMAFEPEIHRWC